jgi:hypothetical protein
VRVGDGFEFGGDFRVVFDYVLALVWIVLFSRIQSMPVKHNNLRLDAPFTATCNYIGASPAVTSIFDSL